MGTIYYNNLFTIDDDFRKAKYHDHIQETEHPEEYKKECEKINKNFEEQMKKVGINKPIS